MKSTIFKKILAIVTGIFAIIGLIFVAVFVGMEFGVFNVKGASTERDQYFNEALNEVSTPVVVCGHDCRWNETNEWQTVKAGLGKDKVIIEDVSAKTGIPSRVIASVVVPEQLRYFTSDREKFKSLFEPLKILGSLSKFSLGVSGIKEETAINIEKYAEDSVSDFYPGEGVYSLISYDADVKNHDQELYSRLSNPYDHYYSYLYTAIYLKEIISQWEKGGFDVSNKPGVLSTIFNIGFGKSIPKANPELGGSSITLSNGEVYSYGEIANLFYNSDEILEDFPR